mmetsp:Transcript_71018/g.219553  ORF Transcript_71018/g.219553 Transcript_71018/m.219553 type:complete len:335 (-) Transcript_71018:36-1040(-)
MCLPCRSTSVIARPPLAAWALPSQSTASSSVSMSNPARSSNPRAPLPPASKQSSKDTGAPAADSGTARSSRRKAASGNSGALNSSCSWRPQAPPARASSMFLTNHSTCKDPLAGWASPSWAILLSASPFSSESRSRDLLTSCFSFSFSFVMTCRVISKLFWMSMKPRPCCVPSAVWAAPAWASARSWRSRGAEVDPTWATNPGEAVCHGTTTCAAAACKARSSAHPRSKWPLALSGSPCEEGVMDLGSLEVQALRAVCWGLTIGAAPPRPSGRAWAASFLGRSPSARRSASRGVPFSPAERAVKPPPVRGVSWELLDLAVRGSRPTTDMGGPPL